jgi:hypothetical protein
MGGRVADRRQGLERAALPKGLTMPIKSIDPNGYHIPQQGSPLLHQNLAWYATDDDRLLGVVIRDLVDNDFSWVILADDGSGQQPGYRCIDMGINSKTQEEATAKLHEMMERQRE